MLHIGLLAIKFISFNANIKVEGTTMNSMSNVRGRKVLDEALRVVAGR
ncbi:hypothetical protein J5U21_00696 [Saccharolobus shibatae]|uniref:Uncharacterized protein n=1 Tax=Saccharolobus shibatae TaxID=2286 RepID=A0A8F5BTA5_9CREN|nr:hypothetical protein J5U21_00696 [Saccharolobus shibatae]